jgi:hypothetical protein
LTDSCGMVSVVILLVVQLVSATKFSQMGKRQKLYSRPFNKPWFKNGRLTPVQQRMHPCLDPFTPFKSMNAIREIHKTWSEVPAAVHLKTLSYISLHSSRVYQIQGSANSGIQIAHNSTAQILKEPHSDLWEAFCTLKKSEWHPQIVLPSNCQETGVALLVFILHG